MEQSDERSAGVRVRNFHQADAEFFTGMASDPAMARWVGDGNPWSVPYAAMRIDDALAGVATDPALTGAVRWFVAHRAGVRLCLVAAQRVDDAVELVWWIPASYWASDPGSVALRLLAEAVTGHFGPALLRSRVNPGNAAGVRAAEKLGFEEVGGGAQVVVFEHVPFHPAPEPVLPAATEHLVAEVVDPRQGPQPRLAPPLLPPAPLLGSVEAPAEGRWRGSETAPGERRGRH